MYKHEGAKGARRAFKFFFFLSGEVLEKGRDYTALRYMA
jgi:hypothetical protein